MGTATIDRPTGSTSARRSLPLLNRHVIFAVFRRNVLSYFSGVLGYLFIVVFVVAGAILAFSPQFFTNNLANLDQLSEWYPMLLLFLVPAITMSAWADEKKLGTDELLFTLPASDVEVMLGKYLAVLAVYTVALLFSVTHLIVLAWIGDPDWGLMFTTYLGYWLAGAALLAAGMFASVLTSSTTVAFVLGAAFCAVPVFINRLAALVPETRLGISELLNGLSVREQLRDFEMGMVPPSGVLYFVSLAAFMLYLNLVFISRRHWGGGHRANMAGHFLVRAIALAAILIGVNVVVARSGIRSGDFTSEKLYSLSDTTRDLIGRIDEKRPVTIQAFVSSTVPRDYVAVRKRLLGLLRQYDQIGGSSVDVRFVDVEPFSQQADEAKLYGINPQRVRSERDGRRTEEDVYLGAVFTTSFDEVIVPFFGAGTPIEYELTRSIRTVSNEKRKTLGILRTDAEVIGGSRDWQIVTELKQQYQVEEVSPDSAIDSKRFDVLLAVAPSSLTEPQMKNLVDYVQAGHPTLIFDDPYPWVFQTGQGVSNAPRLAKPNPNARFGGMMGGMNQQSPPKADEGKATSLLKVLEIDWDNGQVVWDESRQVHPEYSESLYDEFLFITPKAGTKGAFSQTSEITSGLQEMLAIFSGNVRPIANSRVNFEALLQAGRTSGVMDWDEFTQPSFNFMGGFQQTAAIKPDRPHRKGNFSLVLAAHLTAPKPNELNVVFVADLDMISDWFFYERNRGESNLNFDNVTFVLNAVDVLAGDNSYLNLRKRRSELRTLQEVEARTAEFVSERNEQQQKAADEAKDILDATRKRYETEREKIEKDTTIDEQEKAIIIERMRSTEERKLEVTGAEIEREKQQKIDEIKARTERQIKETESKIMLAAVLFPPLPALILGAIMFVLRLQDERKNISPERMLRKRN
ncbi:MAG: Gldg family protein [Planctomycetaceae bacterium]